MSGEKLPRLLSGKQVEREYGIKWRTLASYVAEGILPCVKLGRLRLYDRQVLDEFIASGGRAFAGGWRKEPVS